MVVFRVHALHGQVVYSVPPRSLSAMRDRG